MFFTPTFIYNAAMSLCGTEIAEKGLFTLKCYYHFSQHDATMHFFDNVFIVQAVRFYFY